MIDRIIIQVIAYTVPGVLMRDFAKVTISPEPSVSRYRICKMMSNNTAGPRIIDPHITNREENSV